MERNHHGLIIDIYQSSDMTNLPTSASCSVVDLREPLRPGSRHPCRCAWSLGPSCLATVAQPNNGILDPVPSPAFHGPTATIRPSQIHPGYRVFGSSFTVSDSVRSGVRWGGLQCTHRSARRAGRAGPLPLL